MKNALTYGLFMALAGAALLLLMYFLGFHDTPEKMQSVQWVGMVGGVVLGVVFLSLAMRDKRADFPAAEDWGYGNALGAGVLTSLFASLFGIVTAYLYFGVLNPDFSEVTYQMQVKAMEAKGMSADAIAKAEPMMRKFMSPGVLVAFQAFFGFVWSVVLSLIIAIFFRKREQPALDAPPLV